MGDESPESLDERAKQQHWQREERVMKKKKRQEESKKQKGRRKRSKQRMCRAANIVVDVQAQRGVIKEKEGRGGCGE